MLRETQMDSLTAKEVAAGDAYKQSMQAYWAADARLKQAELALGRTGTNQAWETRRQALADIEAANDKRDEAWIVWDQTQTAGERAQAPVGTKGIMPA